MIRMDLMITVLIVAMVIFLTTKDVEKMSCSVEEYKWFGSTHFKLGCGHGSCVFESDEGIVSLKRATPICRSCCTEDYCNKNCTTHEHGGSIIIG